MEDMEGEPVGQAYRRHAGDALQSIDQAPLHDRDLVAGITRHVQITVDQQSVLRIKTEITVQRTHQPPKRHERRGDKYRANRNLPDQQEIADGKPPPGHATGARLHNLPGIRTQHLTYRDHAEE